MPIESSGGFTDDRSDYSELLVATEQAQNAIQSTKLLKAYNEQGHYAVK